MWVAKSGQHIVMPQLIWYTIDWLGAQQYRELVRVSRSRVLWSLHTSPQDSPEPSNHRGGWVWVSLFLLTPNMWFLHQASNLKHPTGHPLSTDFWYRICGVRADATGWGNKAALSIDASHVFSRYHASNQVTQTWNFHDSTSMLKKSIKLVTKLRKPLLNYSQINVQEKTQKEWNGGDL